MLDESKAISAKDIVNNVDEIFSLSRAYVLLSDMSLNASFSNMVDAINILYEVGWEVDQMSSYNNYMHVLMKNPNYKRKNRPE